MWSQPSPLCRCGVIDSWTPALVWTAPNCRLPGPDGGHGRYLTCGGGSRDPGGLLAHPETDGVLALACGSLQSGLTEDFAEARRRALWVPEKERHDDGTG